MLAVSTTTLERLASVSGLLLMSLTVGGCDEAAPSKTESNDSIKVARMNKANTPEPSSPEDPRSMPTQVPVSAEQTLYVSSLIESATSVVLGKADLEQEERRLFGVGHFHYPKDPRQPVEVLRYFNAENFSVKFVSLSFSRQGRQSPWTSALLSVTPKNAPRGAYVLNMPSSAFAAMKLVKTFAEERPANGNMPAHLVHVFEFLRTEGTGSVQLVFECQRELCDLKAAFPTSFHLLKIARVAGY
jgi:hypothetical protein